MNVDIVALYIFSSYSRFINIREEMYISKMTLIMPYRGNNIKSAKIYLSEIACFVKSAKI